MKRLKPLMLACLCAAGPAVHAASPEALRTLVDRAMHPLMQQHGIPGMAVALTIDGKASFFNYGLASAEHGTPVSERTLFELGSVTKTFTATLACHAQATGKLALDEHPSTYMPALRGSAIDRATLLQLGAYTAGGLPLQFPESVGGEADVPRYFSAWMPEAPPGTQRRYSNPSIGLLGHLTALALGTSVADAFERQLFPALGLRQTWVRIPPQALPRYAWGIDADGKPARMSPDAFDAQAYAVKSSAEDMIRYVQLQLAPGQLPTALRQALACTQAGYYQVGPMVQGLGWEQYRAPVTLERLVAGNSDKMSRQFNSAVALTPPQAAPSGTLFNKTGSTRGFGAYVAFVPARRIGIVMLANKAIPNAARVAAAHAVLQQLGALESASAAPEPGGKP